MELVDCWGDLETGLENSLLPLEPDVFGPFDKAAEISLRLDVLTNAEVTSSFLEEGVDNPLRLRLLNGQRGCCHLLTLLVLSLNKTQVIIIEQS